MVRPLMRRSVCACSGIGIFMLLSAAAAMAQTQLSLQETGLNITADHSGNTVVNIHLDSLGTHAAVYGIVGRADAPGGGAKVRLPAQALPAPSIVRQAGAVDWAAPHQPDTLIVCYDETRIAGKQASPAAVAMRAQKNAVHARLGATFQKELRRINADLIRVAPGADLQAVAQEYARQPGVSLVQPNYRYEAVGLPDDPNFPFVPSTLGPPNDQLLWGLHTTAQDGAARPAGVAFDSDIDAAEAWEVTTGSSDVIVAVIDTGVNYNHPDIVANMWTNAGEIAGNGVDDDGNGFIDDVHGYDFANNDGDPMDDHYHGTHVAGTIGAVANNGVNIAGVCWNVRIMALKFLGADGRGWSWDAAEAVDYAVAMGAAFSNNSWGGGSFDAALIAAISNAGAAGHLFLAAAGNNSTNTDLYQFYPSTYNVNTILSVAAWDKNQLLADFSNYGATTTDIAAPGVGIYSLQLAGGIFSLDGTSMATPHVAGVAALLKAVRPDAGPLQIKQWILDGATPHPNLAGKVLSGGRLNAVEPLRLATMPWLQVGNREGIISAGQSRTIPVTFVTENTPVGSYSGSLIVLDLSYDNVVTPRIEIPVSMELEFVELAPVVEDVNQFVVRNYPMTITLVGSDRNIGQSITFTVETVPALGTLIDPVTSQPITAAPYALVGGGHTVTYVPAANQLYVETFEYTATDGSTTSNTGTVELNVIESPDAPDDVTARSGNIYVELNWLPNVEPNLAGYHIHVSPTAGGPYIKVNAAPLTSTTYRHYPSAANPTYYVVSAVLDFGAESGYSAEVFGQPTRPGNEYTPVNFRATPGYNKVYLAWDAPQTFNGAYRIIREPAGGNAEIIAEISEKFTTTYVDEENQQQWGGGPLNGTTYEYYVENYDYWDLWGSDSNRVTVTPDDYTPPGIPTGVEAIAGVDSIDVRWDFNAELDIDVYGVLRSTTPGGSYYYEGFVTDRRFYDQSVTPDTTYYYVIVAFDIDGDESDWSAEVSATTGTDNTPPAAPANLTATPGDGVVMLDWDDNTEPDLAVYLWYRSTTPGGPYQDIDNDTPSEFSDYNVVNGTTYYYVVTAQDQAGNESPYSNEASATPGTGGCTGDAQCADGVYCNGVETCVAGQCLAGTPVNCNDGIACTVDSCNESTDACDHLANHAACSDGQYCNGSESCNVLTGCQAGTPVDCADAVACTNDACNEATDSCTHAPSDALCGDGVFCNGAETCNVSSGCQAGGDPCDPLLCRESDDACVECLVAGDCDDGLYCNGAEVCDAAGDCQAGADPCGGLTCDEEFDECAEPPAVWMSFIDAATVPGVGTVQNEDIVARDVATGAWSLVFDGSDVSLSGFTIDGLARMADGSILLSFTASGSVAGMTGGPSGTTLDDSDIVRFIPTALGATTAGSFVFHFDGSDVGLTTDNEDLDAIALTSGGQIVVSTLGAVTATGASGADTDLLLFNATSLGSVTAGSFSVYFDGSDVGLADNGNEDVDALAIRSTGVLLLSTLGNFAVPGVNGANEDVVQFTPTQLGATTTGSYVMYLDLSTLGIATSEDVGAVEYKE